MPVIVPSSTAFSVEEFAAHVNRTSWGTDQPEAERHLAAAVEAVEAQCGPMDARSVTFTVTPTSTRVLLPVWPVLEVSIVADQAGAALAGFTVTSAGELVLPYVPYGTLTVTATVGREPVPASLQLATYVIAAHLWETQRGRSARPSGFGLAEEAGGGPPIGFAIPRRAAQLMEPYRQFAVA